MFKKIWMLSFIAIPCIAQAQTIITNGNKASTLEKAEPSIGQVLYNFTYISDTTQPNNPQKEIVALDFSQNYAEFYSQSFKISDSIARADIAKQLKEQAGASNINLVNLPREGSKDVFISDKNSSSVFLEKRLADKLYLVSGGNTAIEWDIQDSTKKIGDYTCQKAIGTSYGRQYIVWFTTDLPYPYGPRRLNGLPGLILEAYDRTDRIVYTFKSYNTSTGTEVGLPKNAINATEKEFNDMMEAYKTNPNAFYNNASASASPTANQNSDLKNVKSFNVSMATTSNGKKIVKRIINFPIDLPEK